MTDFQATTELAIREAIAAGDPTPQWVTVERERFHPSLGLFTQVWNEPHPARVAEQILAEVDA